MGDPLPGVLALVDGAAWAADGGESCAFRATGEQTRLAGDATGVRLAGCACATVEVSGSGLPSWRAG